MRRRAGALLMVACSVGCGRPAETAGTQSIPAKTVYLVHGGYLSCAEPWSTPTGSPTFQHALPAMAAAAGQTGATVPFLASCFGANHDVVYYATDLAPATRSTPTRQLVDIARERIAAVGAGAELVVLGHSYGGWLAMQDVAELAALAPVRYLATIDPISWPDCPPRLLLASMSGDTVRGDPLAACTKAPPDLAGDFAGIAAASRRWSQFYQDRFPFLHSSAIAAAGASTRVLYDSLTDPTAWQAHLMIDRDPRVWGVIDAELR